VIWNRFPRFSHTHMCTVYAYTRTYICLQIKIYGCGYSIQVDYLDSSHNQAVLQMIPRVDYNRKRGHLRSHDGNEVQKTRRRPPQKLFDAQTIRYNIICIMYI